MSESQLKTKILQQGDDPHDFSFRLPCLVGDTVYWIQRYQGENQNAQGDCPVCGGTGSIFGVNGSKWECPSNLCHDGVIVLWRMNFDVEAGEVTGFEVAQDENGEEHCMVWIDPEDRDQRNRHMSVENLFFSEGEALREARRQTEQSHEEQMKEVGGEIPDNEE